MSGASDPTWWTKVSGEHPVPYWRIKRDADIRQIEASYILEHPDIAADLMGEDHNHAGPGLHL